MVRRVRRRLPTLPAIAFLILCGLAALRWTTPSPAPANSLPDPAILHRVARVVDGDTLLLESGHRVRLIGVDTPETKHPDRPPEPWGQEASEFTRGMVDQKLVRLEYDRERFDRYQRVLAYVYYEGWLLNEELIRAGLSPAKTTFPFRSDMQRRFRTAEQQAREAGRGLWSRPTPQPGPYWPRSPVIER